MRLLPLLVSLVLAAPAAAQGGGELPAQAPREPCLLSADGGHYLLSHPRTVRCKVAQRVMRRYLTTGNSPRGWRCRRGRGSDRYDARCRRTASGSTVRAYEGQS